MLRVYLLLVVVGLLGGIGYGAHSYYKTTQEQIRQLTENNAKLEIAVETQKESMAAMELNMKVQAELTNELQKKLQESEVYKDSLISKLQKHNLAALSLKKPALIEKRINDATQKVFREIEADTALDTAVSN
jgi:predicted flavoprotein YhiN